MSACGCTLIRNYETFFCVWLLQLKWVEEETGYVGQYRDINELSHSRLLLRIRRHSHVHTCIQNDMFHKLLLIKLWFEQVGTGCNSEVIVRRESLKRLHLKQPMHTYEDKITGSCRERKITIKTRDGMAWPLENVTHTHTHTRDSWVFFFRMFMFAFWCQLLLLEEELNRSWRR